MSLNEQETKGVKAVMIVEIIGKPPEHLIETLEGIIKQIDEEKGVSVKGKKINEPTVMKEKKDFFTTFAEVEVEVEEVMDLALLTLKYMPAHVEIIYPELIAVSNNAWGDILSEMVRRLHGYDEIARIMQAEKNILERKLREVLPAKREVAGQQGNELKVESSGVSLDNDKGKVGEKEKVDGKKE